MTETLLHQVIIEITELYNLSIDIFKIGLIKYIAYILMQTEEASAKKKYIDQCKRTTILSFDQSKCTRMITLLYYFLYPLY